MIMEVNLITSSIENGVVDFCEQTSSGDHISQSDQIRFRLYITCSDKLTQRQT